VPGGGEVEIVQARRDQQGESTESILKDGL
jgi:hypothetical protein